VSKYNNRAKVNFYYWSNEYCAIVKGFDVKTKCAMILLLAGLLVGCSTTAPSLLTRQDEFTGDNMGLLTDNLLSGKTTANAQVWLNASRIVRKTGVILFFLEIHTESTVGALNIEPGETLILTVDGNEFRFDGIGGAHSRKASNGKYTEDAIYRTTSGDIRKIANAQSIQVKVIGSKTYLESSFSADNIQKFKEFVKTYVDR
jgi:hypothetical protein